MLDPTPNSPADAPTPQGIPLAPPSATTPAAPTPAPSTPQPRIAAPSILEVVPDEGCPHCKAPLAADAVVCVKCGFDLVANKVRTTTAGPPVAPPAPEGPSALPEFSTLGRGNLKTIAILGGATLLGAAIAAAVFAPKDAGAARTAASVALVLYQAILHTGTGLLAVAGAAILTHHRLGRVDLAAARIFLCFSLFLLAIHLNIPLEGADGAPPNQFVLGFVTTARWLLGMALYWALAMLLFRKGPTEAGFLGGLHLILFFAASLFLWLEAWLRAVASAAAPAPIGG